MWNFVLAVGLAVWLVGCAGGEARVERGGATAEVDRELILNGVLADWMEKEVGGAGDAGDFQAISWPRHAPVAILLGANVPVGFEPRVKGRDIVLVEGPQGKRLPAWVSKGNVMYIFRYGLDREQEEREAGIAERNARDSHVNREVVRVDRPRVICFEEVRLGGTGGVVRIVENAYLGDRRKSAEYEVRREGKGWAWRKVG